MPAATARKQQQDTPKGEVTQEEIQSAQFALAPILGEKQRSLLRRGMCAGLTEDQADYFFEVVELTGLNPFEQQIWPSIRQTKDADGVRHPNMFVLVKIQGFRAIGDRSGLCDGEDPVEWCGEDGVWKQEWLLKDPPVCARARVYRKDRSRPQTMVCRWDGYVQSVFDRNGQERPNAIWKRLGSHMLGKVALAGAYRGAFPRQSSAVYISEEFGEGPDTESEAAIEAEMTRRYVRDREYWEAEKAKGHYPINSPSAEIETKPPETPKVVAEVEKPPDSDIRGVSDPATVTHTAHSMIREDNEVSFAAAPKDGPPKPPEPERYSREDLLKFPPKIRAMQEPKTEDPRLDWRTFPISRINLFNGRTLGSLSKQEMQGLIPWLDRVEKRWGSCDHDVRAHYTMILQRIDFDKSQEQKTFDDELSLGMQVPS